jgi:hypothetical protein
MSGYYPDDSDHELEDGTQSCSRRDNLTKAAALAQQRGLPTSDIYVAHGRSWGQCCQLWTGPADGDGEIVRKSHPRQTPYWRHSCSGRRPAPAAARPPPVDDRAQVGGGVRAVPVRVPLKPSILERGPGLLVLHLRHPRAIRFNVAALQPGLRLLSACGKTEVS